MKILKEHEILSLITEENLKNYKFGDMNDAEINRILSFYLYLKNNINEITFEKESLYYSIYFWYHKFKTRYFELYGPDAGIEQESFKLLEEMDNQLINGVDWSVIENIEEN
ncbi:hypothetical protein D3C73_1310690 [compost metagenome]